MRGELVGVRGEEVGVRGEKIVVMRVSGCKRRGE